MSSAPEKGPGKVRAKVPGSGSSGIRTHTAAGMLRERLSKVSNLTGLCKRTFQSLDLCQSQNKSNPTLPRWACGPCCPQFPGGTGSKPSQFPKHSARGHQECSARPLPAHSNLFARFWAVKYKCSFSLVYKWGFFSVFFPLYPGYLHLLTWDNWT